MSSWPQDIAEMHAKFGVTEALKTFDVEKLNAFLDFRIRFLEEEMTELQGGLNGDDVVDALIDLCVVAIGTLDAFGVNAQLAWDRVHAANMAKNVGVKASRPNPTGLPDLIKPAGFVPPNHSDNVGLLSKIY